MTYNYTREVQADGRYNIGYDGETISLAREIQDIFPSHSVSVCCHGTSVNVNMSPDLTAGEKTTLDGLISSHKENIEPAPSPF